MYTNCYLPNFLAHSIHRLRFNTNYIDMAMFNTNYINLAMFPPK